MASKWWGSTGVVRKIKRKTPPAMRRVIFGGCDLGHLPVAHMAPSAHVPSQIHGELKSDDESNMAFSLLITSQESQSILSS